MRPHEPTAQLGDGLGEFFFDRHLRRPAGLISRLAQIAIGHE